MKESERVEALRERARIIVEMEQRYPKSHRYHQFMHFVEAAEESTMKLKGLEGGGTTGRVAHAISRNFDLVEERLTTNLERNFTEIEERLTTKITTIEDSLTAQMESKFDVVEGRLRRLEGLLEKLLERSK